MTKPKFTHNFWMVDGDNVTEEIAQVTSVSDDGSGLPAFIVMDTEYSPRSGHGYNSNLKLAHASFPENFPGPND